MKYSPRYLTQLMKIYGSDPAKMNILKKKLFWNPLWHLTPTEVQVERMKEVLDRFSIKGTFFITANLIERDPWRINVFKDHEFAPHGYLHLNYSTMNHEEGYLDLLRATNAFVKAGVTPRYFRAPYGTPRFGDGHDWYAQLKKTGILISSSRLQKDPPFHPYVTESGVWEFPIVYPTDDAIIEFYDIRKPKQILRELIKPLERVKSYHKNHPHSPPNYLIYCLHPLRMGQTTRHSNYLPIVEAFLSFVEKQPEFRLSSFSTVVDEFRYEKEQGSPRNENENFVVITGDIDCWTFVDYFRRMIHF